ncbi:Os12g0159500 [Oryza sativa Japonica Group]|uniref:Uncharacterized protein n=3 Tax=Oryza sativa TaxID=4530 RepID=A0A8J8YJ44_ORYSJ|nr:hypothetical protein OsI_37549 [Oryza sativa Indica Group]EEE52805.1 hypothetical protein OsJ_35297 [Oryza sativa Japonica Group]KAB8116678.1 hypothetical protein EE612_057922 [Oryza sativa]BAT15978.1 Os12g0159500 [Oryza sativa Japonica Group]
MFLQIYSDLCMHTIGLFCNFNILTDILTARTFPFFPANNQSAMGGRVINDVFSFLTSDRSTYICIQI